MSPLNNEHDVLQLARDLGLKGHPRPLDAILDFCKARVAAWTAEAGTIDSIQALESLVTRQLQITFEEFATDEELTQAIRKYTRQGEGAFAFIEQCFDAETYGTLMQRCSTTEVAPDRYVAFIDCRGDKAARRFFTRWHEIAHILTRTSQMSLPVNRSTDHPLERLMDEIAAQIGFYEPLFRPIVERHRMDTLTLAMIDAVRNEYCPEASFQSTGFACMRCMSSPIIYCEAQMGLKAEEKRRLDPAQMNFFGGLEPQCKLRVSQLVRNDAAIRENFRIIANMRVPESSFIHQVFTGDMPEGGAGENLKTWDLSNGRNLGDHSVWVEARRLPDRVMAFIQAVDTRSV